VSNGSNNSYSITSSTRATKLSGRVMSIAFAVLSLITILWRVGKSRINLTQVPYQGSRQAVADVVAGRTLMTF
jgi:hypothetical protein